MATFKITKKTTVAELKKQFGSEVGGTLRIYEGRSEASNDATLISLGAKEGELECRTSRTVGKFVETFQNELNLKVKVYTNDNWVAVLDGITLSTVKDIPNGSTKAKMEAFLAYERKDGEKTEEARKSDEVGLSEELKGLPLFDVECKKVPWPVTDEVFKQLGADDLLYTWGVIVAYATDENGDFISGIDTSEWDLDKMINFIGKYEKNYPEISLYISSDISAYGIDKCICDLVPEFVRGVGEFAGCEYYACNAKWSLGTPALFRVKMNEETHLFGISAEGHFDFGLTATNEEFKKLITTATKCKWL